MKKLKLLKSQSLQLVFITGLGMFSGLLLDVYFAKSYGTSYLNDSLIIGISVPIFLDIIFRESTRLSLIPLFIKSKEPRVEQKVFFYSVLTGCFIFFITFVFREEIILFLAKGLTSEGVILSNRIFLPLSFSLLFIPQTAVLGARLNSLSKFNIVALRNLMVPSITLIWVYINANNSILLVPQGMLIGIVSYYILLLIINIKTGFKIIWYKTHNEGYDRLIFKATLVPMTGLGVRNISKLYERTIATSIAVGSVSSYYFAFKLVSALQGILGLTMATTGSVKFAQRGDAKMNSILWKQLIKLFSLTIPFTLASIIFRTEIIEIVFRYGNFTHKSLEDTATALAGLMAGLSFLIVNPTLSAALYSKGKHLHILGNTVAISMFGLIIAFLMANKWGLIGLSLSVSITAVLSFLYLLILNILFKR